MENKEIFYQTLLFNLKNNKIYGPRNMGTNQFNFIKEFFYKTRNASGDLILKIDKCSHSNSSGNFTYEIYCISNNKKIKFKSISKRCSAAATIIQKLEFLCYSRIIEYVPKAKNLDQTEFLVNNKSLKLQNLDQVYISAFVNEIEVKNRLKNWKTTNGLKRLLSYTFLLAIIKIDGNISEWKIANELINVPNNDMDVNSFAIDIIERIKDNNAIKDIKDNLTKITWPKLALKLFSKIMSKKNNASTENNIELPGDIANIENNKIEKELAKKRIMQIQKRNAQTGWRDLLFLRRIQDKRKKDDIGQYDLSNERYLIEAAHIFKVSDYKKRMKKEFKIGNYQMVLSLYNECWDIHNGLLLGKETHTKLDKKVKKITNGEAIDLNGETLFKLEYPYAEPSFAYGNQPLFIKK